MNKFVKILIGLFVFLILAVVGAYGFVCFQFQSKIKEYAANGYQIKMPGGHIQIQKFEPKDLSLFMPQATLPEGAVVVDMGGEAPLKLPQTKVAFDLFSFSIQSTVSKIDGPKRIFKNVHYKKSYFSSEHNVLVESVEPTASQVDPNKTKFKNVGLSWAKTNANSQLYDKYKLAIEQIHQSNNKQRVITLNGLLIDVDSPETSGNRNSVVHVKFDNMNIDSPQNKNMKAASQPFDMRLEIQSKDISKDKWKAFVAQVKSSFDQKDFSGLLLTANQFMVDHEIVSPLMTMSWGGLDISDNANTKLSFKPFDLKSVVDAQSNSFEVKNTGSWQGVTFENLKGSFEFGKITFDSFSKSTQQSYQEFLKFFTTHLAERLKENDSFVPAFKSMIYPKGFSLKASALMEKASLDIMKKASLSFSNTSFKSEQTDNAMSYIVDSGFAFEAKEKVKLKMDGGKIHIDWNYDMNLDPWRDYFTTSQVDDINLVPLSVFNSFFAKPNSSKVNYTLDFGSLDFKLIADLKTELNSLTLINPNGAATFKEMDDELGKENMRHIINNVKANLTVQLKNLDGFKKTLDSVQPGASMMIMAALPYVKPSADQKDWISTLIFSDSKVTLNGAPQPVLQQKIDDILLIFQATPQQEGLDAQAPTP